MVRTFLLVPCLLVSVLAAPLPVAADADPETPVIISVGWGGGRGDQTLDSGYTTTGSYDVAQSESGDFPKKGWRLDLELSACLWARVSSPPPCLSTRALPAISERGTAGT